MKTKKILLPGMLATMMFAACTNEEIVTMQNEAPEVDLSDRPVVGMVDLNFGPQTRLAQGDDAFNQVVWENKDKIGARIIDRPLNKNYEDRSANYEAVDAYASSNYEYTKGETDGVWRTEALLVEGHYMFYAPYNPSQGREPLVMEFPAEQTIDKIEKGVINEDAVANFFGNKENKTVLVGHKFIAADGESTIEPFMEHVYAYPQFTIKNMRKADITDDDKDNPVAQDLKITKIIVRDDAIKNKYQIGHSSLIENMRDAVAKDVDKKDKFDDLTTAIPEGYWKSSYQMTNKGTTLDVLKDADGNVVTPQGQETVDVKVNLTEAYTLAYGESMQFHVVLPAVEYNENDLTVNVVFEDENGEEWTYVEDVTFNAVATAHETMTLAPGKRYPREEYDFPTSTTYKTKSTAGKLATFVFAEGDIKKYKPDAAPVYIEDTEDLENYLKTLTDNTVTLTEVTTGNNGENTFRLELYPSNSEMAGEPMLVFNEEVMALFDQYLDEGKVVFKTQMRVEGNKVNEISVTEERYTFAGGVKVAETTEYSQTGGELGSSVFDGKVTLKSVDAGTANMTFNGNATVDGGKFNSLTFEKSATVNNLAEVSVLTLKNGATNLNAKVTGTTNILGGSVTTVIGASYGKVNVQEATFNVTTKDYDLSNVTLGLNNEGIIEAPGILNVKASTKIDPKMITGSINIEANATMDDDFAENKWSFGTVTLAKNMKLTLLDDVTIRGGEFRTFVNNGTVDVEEGTLSVAEGTTITNNYELVVNKNQGTIITGENSRTYVTDTEKYGYVNNSSLSYVEAGDNQSVYAKIAGGKNVAELESEGPGLRYLNKLVFTDGFELEKAFESELLNGIRAIEVKGGDVVVSTFASTSADTLDITGDVTFRGTLDRVNTGFGFKNGATINVTNGKTLTVAYMTMATLDADKGLEIYGNVHVKDANLYIGVGRTPSYELSLKGTIKNHWYNWAGQTSVSVAKEALINAVVNKDSYIELFEDVLPGQTLEINGKTEIALNGHSIKNNTDHAAIKVTDSGDLTVGGGEVSGWVKTGIWNEGNLTIKDGTYNGKRAAVVCVRGKGSWNLTIEDGTFQSQEFTAVSLQNNRAEEGVSNSYGLATIKKGIFTGNGEYWDLYLANVNVDITVADCTFSKNRPYLLTSQGDNAYNSMINGKLVTKELHQNGVVTDWTFTPATTTPAN